MSGEGPTYRAQDDVKRPDPTRVIDERGRAARRLVNLWRDPGSLIAPQKPIVPSPADTTNEAPAAQVAGMSFPSGMCAPLSPGYEARGLRQLLSHDHDGSGLHGPSPLTRRSTMELDTEAKARLVEPEEGLRELPSSLASYEDGLGRLATIVDRLENRIARTLRPASDDDSVMASTGAVTDMGSRIGEYNMTLERIILRLADLEHRCQL